jgi:hypothetical protein
MHRVTLRDIALVLAAILGFHALFVEFPARLARTEPSRGLLPLTAPDCATVLRDPARSSGGWLQSAPAKPDVPASPIRR